MPGWVEYSLIWSFLAFLKSKLFNWIIEKTPSDKNKFHILSVISSGLSKKSVHRFWQKFSKVHDSSYFLSIFKNEKDIPSSNKIQYRMPEKFDTKWQKMRKFWIFFPIQIKIFYLSFYTVVQLDLVFNNLWRQSGDKIAILWKWISRARRLYWWYRRNWKLQCSWLSM